jgi:hypothetical protein
MVCEAHKGFDPRLEAYVSALKGVGRRRYALYRRRNRDETDDMIAGPLPALHHGRVRCNHRPAPD